MKRIAVTLFITIITCLFATADDVVKVLRVYSGGNCTSVVLSGVDSLVHSRYDSDGILHNEHVSSIVHAIDRDYQMSINNIDSIVVLDFDMQRYENEIAEIKKYMDEQEGQEINTFLKNLLIWLKSKENIQDVTYDENIALITIRFRNGLDSHISFQYITDNQEESNTAIAYASTNNKTAYNYYDVHFEADEQIMENTKILHIKGMDMLWGPFNKYNEEKECLEKSREQSPVKFEEIRYSSESLDFMENLSDYGLIVISQTHGGGNGSFVVTRPEASDIKYFYFPSNFVAYVKSGEVEATLYKSTPVYLIYPSLIAKKLRDSDAIVYANYCWSYDLANYVGNDNTVIGFHMKTSYLSNYSYYTSNIFNYILNGITCNKFVKDAVSYKFDISKSLWFWEEKWINVYPSLKSPGYQKRYFSISTNEITQISPEGYPIITGRINGYGNLKKNDLTKRDSLIHLVYTGEGDAAFSPEQVSADDGIILQTPMYGNITDFKISEDGTFSFTYPSILKTNTKYGITYAFMYGDNIYYGETRYFVPEEKNDTVTGGEFVDLGLSVRWASYNYGASMPTHLGTKVNIEELRSDAFYSDPDLFNEDGTKADLCKTDFDPVYMQSAGRMRMPSYEELKELKEKCTWELCVLDGVAGVKVTGPNKNSIFLPVETDITQMPGYGDMYMLNNTIYATGTYDVELGWGLMGISLSGLYMPQMEMASSLNIEFANDYNAYIRPVCE